MHCLKIVDANKGIMILKKFALLALLGVQIAWMILNALVAYLMPLKTKMEDAIVMMGITIAKVSAYYAIFRAINA